MENGLSSFLKDIRKYLTSISELQKEKTKFKWTQEYTTVFDTIIQLLITLSVFHMLMANDRLRLKRHSTKTITGRPLF